jgi:hypothetical protein
MNSDDLTLMHFAPKKLATVNLKECTMIIRRTAYFELESIQKSSPFTRRNLILGAGMLGIVGPNLLLTSGVAHGQVPFCRYMFKRFVVPAAVSLAEGVLAKCWIYNTGRDTKREKLEGELKGPDGSIEDEAAANLAVDPGIVEEYSLEFEPDERGRKLVSCRTPNDTRSARVIVS